MKKKYYLTLDDEFIQYCQLNNIDNIEKLALETFKKGFTILKYGERPNIRKEDIVKLNNQKIIEKWEKLGVLDNLNQMKDETTTKLFESDPVQIVSETVIKKKDLYDE